MRTYIVTDSRGRDMKQELEGIPNTGHIQIHVHPGAGITKTVNAAINTIVEYQPDLVVIMAGICDITKRDRQTKKISLRFSDVNSMEESVMAAVCTAYGTIRDKIKTLVSISTITGLDLTDSNNRLRRHMDQEEYLRYTKERKEVHPDQSKLNNVITRLNKKMTAFNQANGTPTTWTAEIVHPCLRRRHRFYYWRLSDGCHPTPNTRRRWAHQLARTIKRVAARNTT